MQTMCIVGSEKKTLSNASWINLYCIWQGKAITMSMRTMNRMDRSILWAGLHSTNFRTRAIQGIRGHFARLFLPVPVDKCEETGGWTLWEVKYVNNIRNRGFLLLEHTKGIPNYSVALHCLSICTVYSKSNIAVPLLVLRIEPVCFDRWLTYHPVQ
jgi:hypothetical protein